MIKRKVVIGEGIGYDPGAIGRMADSFSHFESHIYLADSRKKINGKSIMGLISLGFPKGREIEVIADGPDEFEAVEKVCELLRGASAADEEPEFLDEDDDE